MSFNIDPGKIIFADLDPSEAVLLNLETKNYYRLNETGQIIWKDLEAGQPIEKIAEHLSEDYNIDASSALNDIQSLIDKLIFENILKPSSKAVDFSVKKAHQSKIEKQPFNSKNKT